MAKFYEVLLVIIYLILSITRRRMIRKLINSDKYLSERYTMPDSFGMILKISVLVIFILGTLGPIPEFLALTYCLFDGISLFQSIREIERIKNLM